MKYHYTIIRMINLKKSQNQYNIVKFKKKKKETTAWIAGKNMEAPRL